MKYQGKTEKHHIELNQFFSGWRILGRIFSLATGQAITILHGNLDDAASDIAKGQCEEKSLQTCKSLLSFQGKTHPNISGAEICVAYVS